MNKRIKELYGNALDKAVPYTWHNLDHAEVEKIMKELAELIIEECTTVIERNLFQGIGWNTSRAVRRHFGIDQVDE
jgi:hypothetical protein